jgi:hypothetical protein
VTPRFVTPPYLEQIGRKLWRVKRPLVYKSALLGTITVPEGFVTDKASVPRVPIAYWLVGARGDGPAVIHDWLTQTQQHCGVKVSRLTTDAVYHEALGAQMPWGDAAEPGWAAWAMWLGVRAGGWWAWWRCAARAKRLNPDLAQCRPSARSG